MILNMEDNTKVISFREPYIVAFTKIAPTNPTINTLVSIGTTIIMTCNLLNLFNQTDLT